MVGEVNKIIYNALVSGRGIYLPSVGTLFLERQAARRLSANKLLSPRNVVAFSSREQALSLVEEIVRIASCSREQAEDIYSRWLDKTRKDNRLVIEGVGELVDKSFRMEEGFARIINPKGVRTLVVRRRSHWWVYMIVLICLAVSTGFFYFAYFDPKGSSQSAASTVAVRPSADDAGVVVEPTDSLMTEVAAEPVVEDVKTEGVAAEDVVAKSAKQSTATEGAGSATFAHYVVYGVYSTEENSVKAVAEMGRKQPDVRCVVLPYKNKYMVTIFGSDSQQECQRYVNRSPLGGLWIYSAK